MENNFEGFECWICGQHLDENGVCPFCTEEDIDKYYADMDENTDEDHPCKIWVNR